MDVRRWGGNKKEAEQRAARNALCQISGEVVEPVSVMAMAWVDRDGVDSLSSLVDTSLAVVEIKHDADHVLEETTQSC
jgi:hypothetical protein